MYNTIFKKSDVGFYRLTSFVNLKLLVLAEILYLYISEKVSKIVKQKRFLNIDSSWRVIADFLS